MYEIFEKLLLERGITAYRVAKETGVTTATLTSWKQGKYVPKAEKLQKIADYLNVSVEYLMTGKEADETEDIKELKGVYFNFAKEMQEKNVSEDDMKRLWDFYEMIQNARK